MSNPVKVQSIIEFREFIGELTIRDRFDLYAMLQVLVVKVMRHYLEESDSFEWWRDRVAIARESLTEDNIDQQNLPLRLKLVLFIFMLTIHII